MVNFLIENPLLFAVALYAIPLVLNIAFKALWLSVMTPAMLVISIVWSVKSVSAEVNREKSPPMPGLLTSYLEQLDKGPTTALINAVKSRKGRVLGDTAPASSQGYHFLRHAPVSVKKDSDSEAVG